MRTRLVPLLLGGLLLGASFWVQASFAVQLYDTYYVIGWGFIVRIMALLCCLIGGRYWLRKRLVNQL